MYISVLILIRRERCVWRNLSVIVTGVASTPPLIRCNCCDTARNRKKRGEEEKDHTWDQLDVLFSYQEIGGGKKKKVCFKFWEADFYYCIVKRTSSVDFRNAVHMLKVVKVLLLQVELKPR